MKEKEIKEFVKNRYSKIAIKGESYCSCCFGIDLTSEQVKAVK